MAWNSGYFEVSTPGNLKEFFTAIKKTILENTNWTFVDDISSDFNLVFQTDVDTLKVMFIDASITDDTSTAQSTTLNVFLVRDGMKDALRYINLQYVAGSWTWDAEKIRTIRLQIFHTDSIDYVGFMDYKTTIPSIDSNCYGRFNTTTIAGGAQHVRYVLHNQCYDANYVANDGDAPLAVVYPNAIAWNCNGGVFTFNYTMRTDSNTSGIKITEYFNDVYNCTTLSANTRYAINGSAYLAINANTLFKL